VLPLGVDDLTATDAQEECSDAVSTAALILCPSAGSPPAGSPPAAAKPPAAHEPCPQTQMPHRSYPSQADESCQCPTSPPVVAQLIRGPPADGADADAGRAVDGGHDCGRAGGGPPPAHHRGAHLRLHHPRPPPAQAHAAQGHRALPGARRHPLDYVHSQRPSCRQDLVDQILWRAALVQGWVRLWCVTLGDSCMFTAACWIPAGHRRQQEAAGQAAPSG
jgi:hypothetical protein